MASVESNQATTNANVSMASAASNARYWKYGCSEDKCVETCGDDWEKNGDFCYLWKTDKKNWTSAEDFCQQEGCHLASPVHSNFTNDYISVGLRRRGLNRVWLGGNDIDREGVWQWMDCTPWENTFWNLPTEPNNSGGEHCLEHYYNGWNDQTCSSEQGFVCSKKICSGGASDSTDGAVTATTDVEEDSRLEKETLLIGLVASAVCNLLLLLLLIGAVCLFCKRQRRNARNPIKIDVNPVYDENKEDYDYMG